jgi:hypothetical protein
MFKEKEQIKIIEVDTPSKLRDIPQEALQGLESHPGFQYLLQRLALQRAALKTKLCNEVHSDIRAVDVIQAGIFWSGWLERQLGLAVAKNQAVPRNAIDEELREFQKISEGLREVGL